MTRWLRGFPEFKNKSGERNALLQTTARHWFFVPFVFFILRTLASQGVAQASSTPLSCLDRVHVMSAIGEVHVSRPM